PASRPAFRAAVADVAARMRTALGHVEVRYPEGLGGDRRSALVTGVVDRPISIDALRASVLAAGAAHPRVTIEETGDVTASDARDRIVNRDLHRAELLSVPVTLLILLF